MRKSVSVFLLVLSFLTVLGAGLVTAKTLDKASPKLANQVNESLSGARVAHVDSQFILWAPSKSITKREVKTVVWAIPTGAAEVSQERVRSGTKRITEELPKPLQKEINGVVVVIMDELSICDDVKTVLYTGPIETNLRIGIFSTSKDPDIDDIEKSIVAALSNETDEEINSKNTEAAW